MIAGEEGVGFGLPGSLSKCSERRDKASDIWAVGTALSSKRRSVLLSNLSPVAKFHASIVIE